MSLEECKRLADERRERIHDRRRSKGRVDGKEVEVVLARNHPDLPPERWVIVVSAYGEISSRYFKKKEKLPAEKYFEKLTRDYGLQEEEK